MHTSRAALWCFCKGGHDVWHLSIRSIISHLLVFVLVGSFLSALPSSTARGFSENTQQDKKASKPVKANTDPNAARPAYDCSNGGQIEVEVISRRFALAIKMASEILKDCAPCRMMFGTADAIAKLEELKQNQAIVVSKRYLRWDAIVRRNMPTYKSEAFKGDSAVVLDLANPRFKPGVYTQPCIYLNVEADVFNDYDEERARWIKTYETTFAEMGARVIIHELAHIMNMIQGDDIKTPEGRRRSEENNDCVYLNCQHCSDKYHDCAKPPANSKVGLLFDLTSPKATRFVMGHPCCLHHATAPEHQSSGLMSLRGEN
jgi:hypothetical protein